jgi:general stress protein 26
METFDDPKALADLLDPGMTMMVATMSPQGHLVARPLTVADVADDTIRVLVDTAAAWAQAIGPGDEAHVAVSDNRKNVWASLHTSLDISHDDAAIDALWNPAASAYFADGRQSAGIGVLHIRVLGGLYWTSPSGRLGSIIGMIKAAVGDPADGGDHGMIDL